MARRIQGKTQGNARIASLRRKNAKFLKETRGGFRSEKGRNREILREKPAETGKIQRSRGKLNNNNFSGKRAGTLSFHEKLRI
ncbi:MAG: hypothetical protein H6620_12235 [Halobacteriovoraceae bacterium]|nr:hypothetical protein [Halobacteriovoraceae bacterium]